MSLRIVLMGTGAFAVPSFRALMDSRHTVVGVLTQPDKTGRGHHRHINPVKELAVEREIKVLQPERVNRPEILEELRGFAADAFIVASYGQILKPALLTIPRLGAFNLHGSLLPRNRGAAPVQYSIWKGDKKTGVTVFQIEPALDSGPMIGTISTEIQPKETSGDLMLRLAELSVPLILDCCDQLSAGTAEFESQDPSLVTLAPKLEKEQGIVDWSRDAFSVDCHVRAMQPWPRATSWLQIEGQSQTLRCLLMNVQPVTSASGDDAPLASRAIQPDCGSMAAEPGRIILQGQRMFVTCGILPSQDTSRPLNPTTAEARPSLLEIITIQPDGKRAMDAASFINGYPLAGGACFRSVP